MTGRATGLRTVAARESAIPRLDQRSAPMPPTVRRGSVTGYALEQSNVELEDQFVEMISGQRAYQANSRVVSTANDTLQELVNLV